MTNNITRSIDTIQYYTIRYYWIQYDTMCSHTGDENALDRLALQPETFSRVDERGWIPLHEAAVHQNKRILEIIFSGSDVTAHVAVIGHHKDSSFLNADVGVWILASLPGATHCRTLKGETPLFLAVVHGLRENATFLLQNGCSPDLQNDEQDSPLVAGIWYQIHLNAKCTSFTGP